MMPINPFPPLKLGRPFVFLGLAACAATLALWAKRQAKASRGASAGQKLIRVEPTEQLELTVEVPWTTEVPR